jgi:hypothetical protein
MEPGVVVALICLVVLGFVILLVSIVPRDSERTRPRRADRSGVADDVGYDALGEVVGHTEHAGAPIDAAPAERDHRSGSWSGSDAGSSGSWWSGLGGGDDD